MLKITRSFVVAIIAALFLTSPEISLAQSKPERVRFAKGSSSARLTGTITGYNVKDYILGASAGQQMRLKLASSNTYANFVVFIRKNGTDEEFSKIEMQEWAVELPETGDYVIRVLMMRAGARRKGARADYKLTVEIH